MKTKENQGKPKIGGNASGTQAIDRALSILSHFDFEHQSWGATDLARSLGLTIPTTQRILKAMQAKGFLETAKDTGKIQLGLRIFELGALVESRLDIVKNSEDLMLRLKDETNETVYLVIVDGDELLYIKKVQSLDVFGIVTSVGMRRPLTTGSLGKAVLSTFQEDKLKQYLAKNELIQYTKRSITDKSLYLEEITKVRVQGFAVDFEGLFDGVCGIAAPITLGNSAVGAIALVFPTLRFNEERVLEWGRMVRQIGVTISQRLTFLR